MSITCPVDVLTCFHVGFHVGPFDDPGLQGNPETIDAVTDSLERWAAARTIVLEPDGLGVVSFGAT